MNTVDGILLVDKPAGKTSHQVVDEVRWILEMQKVGHTGTLDPDATGLLVLCLGKALKIVEFMEPLDKEYEVAIRLGVATDTLDMSGRVLSEAPVPVLSQEELEGFLRTFVGEVEQRPPAVSAVKIGGERSYRLARQGIEVHPPPRKIQIHAIDFLEWASPSLTLRVRCSKGTYIRALARDLGEAIGCGGTVERLRRAAVGPFRVEQAVRLEDSDAEQLKQKMLPVESGVSHLPKVDVDEEAAHQFCQGKAIPATAGTGPFARIVCQGTLVGIGEAVSPEIVRPRKVLAPN